MNQLTTLRMEFFVTFQAMAHAVSQVQLAVVPRKLVRQADLRVLSVLVVRTI